MKSEWLRKGVIFLVIINICAFASVYRVLGKLETMQNQLSAAVDQCSRAK